MLGGGCSPTTATMIAFHSRTTSALAMPGPDSRTAQRPAVAILVVFMALSFAIQRAGRAGAGASAKPPNLRSVSAWVVSAKGAWLCDPRHKLNEGVRVGHKARVAARQTTPVGSGALCEPSRRLAEPGVAINLTEGDA